MEESVLFFKFFGYCDTSLSPSSFIEVAVLSQECELSSIYVRGIDFAYIYNFSNSTNIFVDFSS
jgi:hypothetical protein